MHNFLEIFNEIAFIYLHYFMLFFNYGDYVEPRVQWNAGKVAAGIIVGMYLVNFGYLVIFMVGETKRLAKLKKIKYQNGVVHEAKKKLIKRRNTILRRRESRIKRKQLSSTESCEADSAELVE